MTEPAFESIRWVNLEPIGACNLACPGCPRNADARPQGAMDPELYWRLLSQVPDKAEVRLFLSGEPFLDVGLRNRVRRAREMGHPVLIHTNGTHISSMDALHVIAAKPTTISVSVDGADGDEYARMRPPATLAKVRFGLDNLLYERDVQGSKTRIVVQTIVPHGKPLDHNAGLRDMLPRLDDSTVRHPHNWAEAGSVPGAAPCKPVAAGDVCAFLTQSMAVQADGKVVLCCAMLNAEHVAGDANTESLRAIWNGPMREVRQAMRERKPLPVCSGCERYGVR